MLDETLTSETSTTETKTSVPATQFGNSDLMMIPLEYATDNFDRVMQWAENWAEESFGVNEVNVCVWQGEFFIAPARHGRPKRWKINPFGGQTSSQ